MVSIRSLSLISAAISTAMANSILFVNQDDVDRTIICTASAGIGPIPNTVAPAFKSVTVQFPQGWIGNCFAVADGGSMAPGMLAEVAFQGWDDLTYFDVSAIVNPTDKTNVKQMWPAVAQTPLSGCITFPCNDAYYLPDDLQTKSTDETDLVCSLGTPTIEPAPPAPSQSSTASFAQDPVPPPAVAAPVPSPVAPAPAPVSKFMESIAGRSYPPQLANRK